jgi:hypothetical protein
MPGLVNSARNKFDAIEQLIFSNNLRIKSLDIRQELNIMNIILNTGFIIRTSISSFPSLKKASRVKLLNYKLIGNGTGIHWPSLNEDLSLKGLLKDELLKIVDPSSAVAD